MYPALHTHEARSLEDTPLLHTKHVASAAASIAVEYLPSAQRLQTAEPAAEYLPAMQVVQTEEPAAEYLPAMQVVQTAEPAAEYLPASQVVQTEAPEVEYLPAAQLSHSVAATTVLHVPVKPLRTTESSVLNVTLRKPVVDV